MRPQPPTRRARRRAGLARAVLLLLVTAAGATSGGCAAVTNPVADGLLVRHVPPELLAPHRDGACTIPLDLLGQPAPDVYRLAPKDVLGVWVEGVLGDKNATPPVTLPVPILAREQRRLPPSFGYPVPVRSDGTVHLPLIGPVRVAGLSVSEAEESIRDTYRKEKILPAGRERVIVTLMYPRQVQVVVLRQESSNIVLSPESPGVAGAKRNTGQIVDLPGYENDVLHALAQSGGLPGLDAYNEVIVFRNASPSDQDRLALLETIRNLGKTCNPTKVIGKGGEVVRIPLRRRPDEPLPFGPQDVVLHTGDVVFIEARDCEVFYTGGLLPAGEHVLPRDYDLDVVTAITRVRGPLVNGSFATNQLSGNLVQPGLGSPSAALLTVLRRTPDGGQVPIRVDLTRALRDPRERIVVRAGDVLILQERPFDAVARYTSQTFFNFNLVWEAFHSRYGAGVVDIAAPDRLGTRAFLPTIGFGQ